MTTLAGYIDSTGIHVPTYSEILASLQERYRAIFGADLYLEADSQEGQMLAMFALAVHDANQLAVSVYNAFSPATAQGAGLSRMVTVNGLVRKVASRSTVDVTIIGTAGTIISFGVVQDAASQKWDLPSTVVIPTSGEITVTATAQDVGDLQAAAGEVNKISTPTRGWQSVSNAAAATPGAAVETDYALRRRQAVSTALPSQAILAGMVGAVANLPGVTRCKGYENDSGVEDENGMPAHSVSIVVEGGDDAAIAAAIAGKKAPGARSYGTTSYTVTDVYGMPNTINFFRAGRVDVAVAIGIMARPGYLSTTGAAILANVAAYLNGQETGEGILLSKLYTPINAAEPDSAKKTFDVLSLTIGRAGGALAASNLDLAFHEVAVGDVANMTLTVS